MTKRRKRDRTPKLVVYKTFFKDELASYRPSDHSIHIPRHLATADSPVLKHELRHANSYLVWLEARFRKWYRKHTKPVVALAIVGFVIAEVAGFLHLPIYLFILGLSAIIVSGTPMFSLLFLRFLAEREAYWAETHDILEPSMIWHWPKRKR